MASFHGMSAAGASMGAKMSPNHFDELLVQREARALSDQLAVQMHYKKNLAVRIATVAEDAKVEATPWGSSSLNEQALFAVEAVYNHLVAQLHGTKELDVQIATVAEDTNGAATQASSAASN